MKKSRYTDSQTVRISTHDFFRYLDVKGFGKKAEYW